MKTVSVALKAHLALEVTTLSTCWHITRTDGVEFFFTDHDQDLIVAGDTYAAATGYLRTAIATEMNYAVDNVDVQGAFDSAAIKEDELRAGLFDHAEVLVFMVNWADLTMGIVRLRRGWFGEALLSKQGIFHIELRGMFQKLMQTIGLFYTSECTADLGDAKCKIPLLADDVARNADYIVGAVVRVADPGTSGTPSQKWRDRLFTCTVPGTTAGSAPSYDYTVGHSTTDGTAHFIASEAWTRAAVVAAGAQTTAANHKAFNITVTDARDVDGWFTDGAVTFETGANAGATIEVRGWTQTGGIVSLFLKAPFAPAAGDRLYLWPGCSKSLGSGCHDKFNNVLNFRGFGVFTPGQDFLVGYATAGQI